MMISRECPPDAPRAIVGFRDTGYDLNTAVADVIDNSINAKAENVWVVFDKDPAGQLHARIVDDGYGMDEDDLFSAMKYGSPEKGPDKRLGRFGLGLKTASTSVCRQLTVVSRKSASGKIVAARWDLDLVIGSSKWLLQIGEPEPDLMDEYGQYVTGSGTMICWDAIDRIGTHDEVDKTGITNQALGAYLRRLRDHLSLTFHRFIESGRVKLWLQGDLIEPWNPFVPIEKTDHAIGREFHVQVPGSEGTYVIKLNAYIIPNKYEYSTKETLKSARVSSSLQGFYVYREDRVIINANWLGMFDPEPHYALLRIELSFPRELDNLLSVDIKKSTLHMDAWLFDKIKQELAPVRRRADQRYRQGKKQGIKDKGSPHDQSTGLIDSKYEETTADLGVHQVGENKVEIKNVNGTTVVTMPTIKMPGLKDLIEVVDSLPDGQVWEPVLINGRIGVRINRGHVYYERVYVPNFKDTVTVQGIDSILWALAKCEQEVLNQDMRKKLTDLRYYVSRTLRELAEELPEPSDTDE